MIMIFTFKAHDPALFGTAYTNSSIILRKERQNGPARLNLEIVFRNFRPPTLLLARKANKEDSELANRVCRLPFNLKKLSHGGSCGHFMLNKIWHPPPAIPLPASALNQSTIGYRHWLALRS